MSSCSKRERSTTPPNQKKVERGTLGFFLELRNLVVVGAAEELFDFADVRGSGVGGEALDKDFAVLFFEDAAIEQD